MTSPRPARPQADATSDDAPHAAQGPDEPVDPLDIEYFEDMLREFFGPLRDCYFRPRLIHADRLPEHGPAIFAGNHSGSAFPYDGMVLDSLLWNRHRGDPSLKCRSVYETTLSHTWWMRPFGIDNFWRRGGGVDMTFDNFDRLLARGQRVLYYPEGVPGIGKGFARRYQLQEFKTSFVILAARRRAPVYPIYIVNAEWVIPFSFMIGWVDRLVQKLGVPFLPLPAGPLAVLFPFLWYLALPARMIFVVGRPFHVAQLVEELELGDPVNLTRHASREVARVIRDRMQERLDYYVGRYGQRPYQLRSLAREWRKAKGRRSLMVPFTWVWTFVTHSRDRRRPPARNFLHRWLRDWDLFGYYLPLGWFFLALTRRWRRPPCGYRGLSDRERRRREGRYHWHLKDHPLPPPR